MPCPDLGMEVGQLLLTFVLPSIVCFVIVEWLSRKW